MPANEPSLIVFALCTAASGSLIICVNADLIGRRLKVMDYPDSERKRHGRPTPQVGGIAITLALAFLATAMLMTGYGDTPLLLCVLLCGAGAALVGFADDQSSTTPLARLLSLTVFLGLAFTIAPGLYAPMIHWGSFEPTPIVPWAYYALAGLAVLGLVNAVNMADGQNGVVLSMFVVWSACLLIIGDKTIAAVAAILLVTSAVAFVFNVRGKLFLGDCGTYGVTFVLSLLTIFAHARGEVRVGTIIVWYFIPVMDCLRLLISRPLRGKSPFAGDRDHFHHRLEDKLGQHLGLATYASAVGLTSAVSAVAPRFALLCLTVLTAFYFSFAWLTASEAAAARDRDKDEGLGRLEPANIIAFGAKGSAERKSDGML